MGVNGLWTVVQPCARPTNLATLNRKRLAVDASIWIYQFLKAVRDKEGNALRNSHVVGFFRRICKLLWFGILPVFVFDGGAPALKRQTIQGRQRRREGRRDDAVRTAGKLLAVQMKRIAEEEEEKKKERDRLGQSTRQEPEEIIPQPDQLIYVDEVGMSQKERQQTRGFRKKDAYHLPDLDGGGIAAMGKPEDPRIMSVEELEDYARQFHNGEDVNLYDFSKIDFNGEFFKSLPPPDRYNILNAARLRSRLRMGLSKEQLEEMFPDRMAFSRFQIERVQERNHLTQRLMAEVGMTGTDLTLGVNARVAGEKNREYILVKNEGVEGGWALGVVSKEKDIGEAHKPIDVDAIQVEYQSKNAEAEDEEDEVDFEDVPIEGLNRLPKPQRSTQADFHAARDIAAQRQQLYGDENDKTLLNDEGSLFVGGDGANLGTPVVVGQTEQLHPEEADELNKAIALSLMNQHGGERSPELEEANKESPPQAPEWTQKSAQMARPITAKGGSMIAHVVNNRANAAIPKRRKQEATADSDSEEDMQSLLNKTRKARKPQTKPVFENKKNPFDGPLPFPKLDWGSSLFAKRSASKQTEETQGTIREGDEDAEDMAGGFETTSREQDAPKPLPPWLTSNTDIRESMKQQREAERAVNAEDRLAAEEEANLRRREYQDRLIEIESSSDDGSDVVVVEVPASSAFKPANGASIAVENTHLEQEASEANIPSLDASAPQQNADSLSQNELLESTKDGANAGEENQELDSPEPEFEDVVLAVEPIEVVDQKSPTPSFEEVPAPEPSITRELEGEAMPDDDDDDDAFFADDVEYDEFSDPGDEELMAQMAEEAEEHARFASELNNKSAEQNRVDYEQELRALRNQQKKDRRDADEVTQVMVTECQALLRLFGIPYITAPMEAEAQCAELVRLGLVDGIVTDDSDTFLFGGTRVYKNMFNSNKFVECYLGADMEKELSLSREQLISLAQLLGSDYTEGLPGVGPVTAVEILSEFPGKAGLENFRDWWNDVQSLTRSKELDTSPFRKKFRKSQAAKLFLPTGFPNPAVYDAYLHPEVDHSAEPFQWGVPDLEGLRQFLMATIGWGKERTDEVLVPVIKDMNKREREGTQSNITRFFGGSVGVGAKEAFAPRQKAQGSKRMAAAVDKLRANATSKDPSDLNNESGKRKRVTRGGEVEESNEGDGIADTSSGRRKGKRTKAAS